MQEFVSFYHLIVNFLKFSNKDEISEDRLADANLIVFGGPREPFSVVDFKEIKSWLNGGGRALVLLADGGETASGCNMNYLLEE
jgi:intraflagellar transport protein 52